MDWYGTVLEVIDLRSFSNLWYWIGLAVLWSTTTHWVLGIPYDTVMRARRLGGEAEEDLHLLVRIYCRRLKHIGQVAGLWIVLVASTALTMLAVTGFWYEVEFAQALFLMVFPLSLVAALSFYAAGRILDRDEQGDAVYRRLRLHRLMVRSLGMISIFVTALWGMYQNLNVGPLGG